MQVSYMSRRRVDKGDDADRRYGADSNEEDQGGDAAMQVVTKLRRIIISFIAGLAVGASVFLVGRYIIQRLLSIPGFGA
jgi:hypothetical protein